MRQVFLPAVGARLRYHDLPGAAPPLLMLHGLGCTASFDYPDVAAQASLAGQRRLLLDLLGSGYSDQPTTAAYTLAAQVDYLTTFLTLLDLPQCIVYGHSMGGTIAIMLAAQCPRVCGLIVSEPNLHGGGGPFSTRIAGVGQDAYVQQEHERLSLASDRAGNSEWATGLRASLPLAVHQEATALVAGQTPTWAELFFNLSIPRTYIWGEQSVDEAERITLLAHGIAVAIVPAAGHAMAWENPAGLAQAIGSGLERVLVTLS